MVPSFGFKLSLKNVQYKRISCVPGWLHDVTLKCALEDPPKPLLLRSPVAEMEIPVWERQPSYNEFTARLVSF